MKWMFLYLWHGQDLGLRMLFGMIAAGAVFTPHIETAAWSDLGTPQLLIPAGVAFLMGAVGKKNGGE